MKTNPALSALRHHVTEIPAPTSPAHTPGPWDVEPKGSRHFVDGADGLTVAYLDRAGVRERVEIEANARLIASAPELLEALERISTAYDETLRHPIAVPLLNAIYGARAAIAKAKGGAA